MGFRLLQNRLIAHLQGRVRNGEITERGLARLCGVSQPHLHNVLKGVRELSTDTADQILRSLRLEMADLMEADDGRHCLPETNAERVCYRMVPQWEGCIGPGHPFPPRTHSGEKHPFPTAMVTRMEFAVAARLAPDPHMAYLFGDDAVALLDCSEGPRKDPEEGCYYAVDWAGSGAIRMLLRGTRCWHLVADGQAPDWRSRPSVIVAQHSLPLVVQARVTAVLRRL
jgi:hypothetical protein